MTDYGAGPALDRDNDFIVDKTGDIKSTVQESSVTAELEKDLAFKSQVAVGSQIGNVIRPSTAAVIRSRIREVTTDDPRVDRVLSFEINESEDSYEVSITVQTVDKDSDINLIFEIN